MMRAKIDVDGMEAEGSIRVNDAGRIELCVDALDGDYDGIVPIDTDDLSSLRLSVFKGNFGHPAPAIGTKCTMKGSGLLPLHDTPEPWRSDNGKNGLRGRLHGRAIEDGGEFVYLGDDAEGKHWFLDTQSIREFSLWHSSPPSIKEAALEALKLLIKGGKNMLASKLVEAYTHPGYHQNARGSRAELVVYNQGFGDEHWGVWNAPIGHETYPEVFYGPDAEEKARARLAEIVAPTAFKAQWHKEV